MQNPPPSSSSSRAEAFPAGLRVLVVDDDPTWLKILEKMLKKCSYEVTTCGLARVALDMLRERRDRFDIVISDVNMPDMDGFKLLEHVGLEMDLPVIMMSVDGETSRVMKGVQHGACDYLLKPVRMKELRNIWQHVFRKKMHEMKEVESHHGSGREFQLLRNRFEEYEERTLVYGGDQSCAKRRKDADNKEHSEVDFVDTVSVKKARVVWTVELHKKFVNAVNQIGFDKVGPKKILDLMNVPGLTRENVASHLQKYRLYLSRLQKQNDGITFGGAVVPSDPGSNESMGNLCLQSSKADGFRLLSKQSHPHPQGIKQEASGDEVKGVIMQREVPRKALSGPCAVSQKARTTPQLFPPLKGVAPNALKYKPDNRSRIPDQHGWSGNIPAIPSKQCSVHGQGSFSLATDYGCLQQTREEHLRDDHFGSASASTRIIPTTTRSKNASGSFQTSKPTYADYNRTINTNNNNIYLNSVPVVVEHGIPLDSKHLNFGRLDSGGPLDMKGRYYADQCFFGSSDSGGQNNQRDCSTPEDLLLLTKEWCGRPENVGMGIPNHDINPCQPPELPGNLYDGLQLDCEHVLELMKHPTIGGDLFT